MFSRIKMIAALGLAVALTVGSVANANAEAKISWKGSTKIEDKDAGYSVKFGGRIMNDWSWVDADDDLKESGAGFVDDIMDGTEFRRVRLYTSGTVYKVVYFKSQFDFAGGAADVKDMYIGLKKVPGLGNVQVGHMHEPFGLEELTSSKVITFMERASTSAMTPSRKTGIMVKRELDNKRATFAAGVFRNSDDFGEAMGNKYNYTGRVTVVPVKDDESKTLVHLGGAVSVREPDGDEVRFRARPANHLSPRYVNTDKFETDRVIHFGGEGAAVFGPASLQSEFIYAQASNDTLDDPNFSSFYVQGSFLLTGESRGYKGGLMGGVKPENNFDGEGGKGAWELAARFAKIDLDSDMVMGGTMTDVTVGVNWYLNPYTRVMLNYVYADVEDLGASNSFMTRFQIAF